MMTITLLIILALCLLGSLYALWCCLEENGELKVKIAELKTRLEQERERS